MFRSAQSCMLGAVCTASIVLTSAGAQAQSWHGGGHYDYRPGHSHGYHSGHSTYYPGTSYAQPGYENHPYDHQNYERTEYSFGGFGHIDDLAMSLEQQANLLCWELHYNYQHNPGYRPTYREAYEMLQSAKFIHGLEHARNRDRIREEVVRLDSLFHHIQRDVAHWTGHHHRRVGRGGLTGKLEVFEETLHHLMDEVGVRSQPGALEGGILDSAPAAPPADALPPLVQP